MADDDQIKEIAKSLEEGLKTIGDRISVIEKEVSYLKKEGGAYNKKGEEEEESDDKKGIKTEAAPSEPTDGPEPIDKEWMENLLKTTIPSIVTEEIQKNLGGTGTSQTAMPGAGAVAPVTAQPQTVAKGEDGSGLEYTMLFEFGEGK